MLFHGSSKVHASRQTPQLSSTWSTLKRILLTAHFFALAFLWDGSLDLVCPSALAQMRGLPQHNQQHTSNQLNNLPHLPQVPNLNHPHDDPLQPISKAQEKVTSHDPNNQDITHAHNVGNIVKINSGDAKARQAELLHTLDQHKTAKTMHTFHQSYSAGPPPSPFWDVLNGRQTKMSDLRPTPKDIQNRPLLSVVMVSK